MENLNNKTFSNKTFLNKTFLWDYEITDTDLIKKLERNFHRSFELVSDGHYICKGYRQPLLAHINDKLSYVCDPLRYSGSYTYNGEDEITLHASYGRFVTYKKMIIFGLPFMVCTGLTEDDAILAAMTDKRFIESLIKVLG